MTSATLTYQLPTFSGLFNHGHDTLLLRDQELSDKARHKIDVEVRSGDYFITLATTLDLLSQNVSNHHIRASLDTIVTDLVYLQNNYRINKKDERTQ